MASTQRSDGEGSLYPRHKPDCPKPVDKRGNPSCKCPWVGVVVLGWDGKKPVRRKVTGSSRANAAAKLRDLRERENKRRIVKGEIPTVEKWLTIWLEDIVKETRRHSTYRSYGTYVRMYLIPLLGSRRIDKLMPEHLECAWRVLATEGCPGKKDAKPLSGTSVHQAHVILSRALKVAMQRGYVDRNVCQLIDAPSIDTGDMPVLSKEQARKVVEAAHGRPDAARWTVAFTLGLRQGEALGLRWRDVDLDAGVIRVRHSLGRVKGQGMQIGEVKSKTGRRDLAVPGPLLAELKAHRKAQNAARLAAGDWWQDNDLVFCTAMGRPLDSKYDWKRWRALLEDAGVPHVRLHAARHTAVTMMLALGVAPHVVKEIAGHAKFSTTEVYIDKVDELHLDAAAKMSAFWD